MDISALVIRIIFLLLPGAVAASIYWKMKGRATRKDWEDFLEVIVFSLFSYAVYASIVHLINWNWSAGVQFTAFDAFFDDRVAVRWQDIFFSSLAGVCVALIASYSYQFKIINKFGKLVGATQRFGDEDVWDFVHRSPDVRGSWVIVRDHKLNLYYTCWIQAFSDSGKERELLLREVDVYDDASAEWRYSTPVMYLSRKQDELTIEILSVPDQNELTTEPRETGPET
ncbi:MAG: DUF6338 family protein [Acidobacteria bacterium]|nr:DUF6338 family protein [Acidobacteriota bacterium]